MKGKVKQMTKEYAKTYCHSMRKSLNDKLFFLKEIDINSYDVIVDFGCADGALLEALCDKSILSNENTKLIGIEKSSTLTELCRARLGDKVLISLARVVPSIGPLIIGALISRIAIVLAMLSK